MIYRWCCSEIIKFKLRIVKIGKIKYDSFGIESEVLLIRFVTKDKVL